MAESNVRLPRKPKGERPQYFADPAVDKLISIILSLAGEVAVMHDRHDTLERVMAARGLISRDDIESFIATAEVLAERDKWREAFLAEVLRVVRQDREMLEREMPRTYQSVVEAVSV
jgi:hypothetical protein